MTASSSKEGHASRLNKVKIAVIGLGPAGLSAIKSLREEGFDAVGFERRDRVGGVWSYSYDTSFTSVIHETVSNVSKFVSGFSDFPVPRELPPHMTGAQVGEYLESYARYFRLEEHIRFSTTVSVVLRDHADEGWDVHIVGPDGRNEILHFDKVVFGSGSDSVPVWPPMPGRDEFKGSVLHGQSYRNPQDFAGQRVLVVGIGNTACEVALSLTKHARRVYQSYRRGRIIISRYNDEGSPTDIVPWPKMQFKYMLDYKIPRLATFQANRLMRKTMVHDASRHEPDEPNLSSSARRKRAEKRIREDWRLVPFRSMELTHPAVQDNFVAALYSGKITPATGFKRFLGPDEVALEDGTTIQVDAVIFCTGYKLAFDLMPELEMDGACGVPLTTAGHAKPGGAQQGEPSLPRLYQMMFPPRWASSVAFLSWFSVLETAWCVCDLASMALAQVWATESVDVLSPSQQPRKFQGSNRKPARLPSEAKMNAAVDAYHAWWRQGRLREPAAHAGFVQPYDFYRFLHDMAGTGMYDQVGHKYSLCNLKLWWKDRDLHRQISKGPASSHAWRVFDTNPQGIPGCGRRAWPPARQAVEDTYLEYEDYKVERKREAGAKGRWHEVLGTKIVDSDGHG